MQFDNRFSNEEELLSTLDFEQLSDLVPIDGYEWLIDQTDLTDRVLLMMLSEFESNGEERQEGTEVCRRAISIHLPEIICAVKRLPVNWDLLECLRDLSCLNVSAMSEQFLLLIQDRAYLRSLAAFESGDLLLVLFGWLSLSSVSHGNALRNECDLLKQGITSENELDQRIAHACATCFDEYLEKCARARSKSNSFAEKRPVMSPPKNRVLNFLLRKAGKSRVGR